MNPKQILLRKIRWLTWLFILGLVLSGVTALPLPAEVNWLARITGAQEVVQSPGSTAAPAWAQWLVKVQSALVDTNSKAPFLFYGTDWLAFGHFVIAIAFIGAVRDPVRNSWLFRFGIIACAMVIPYALIFGAIRGIPFWWRVIDCSFGIFGIIPLLLGQKWARKLEQFNAAAIG